MALEGFSETRRIGWATGEGQQFLDLNSAWTGGSAGDGIGLTFPAIVAVSGAGQNLSIWIWVKSVTGTNPTCTGEIFDISTTAWETNQAGGTVITNGTSAATTITTGTPGWYEIKWTGVTLTQRKSYQVWFYNSSGAPTTDHFVVADEGGAETGDNAYRTQFAGQRTTGGGSNFVVNRANPPLVVQLNPDATVTTFGYPAVVTGSPGSDTKVRGLRLRVSEEITVWGVRINSWNDPDAERIEILEGSTIRATATKQDDMTLGSGVVAFDVPYTLKSETTYDILLMPNASTPVAFNDMTRISAFGSETSEAAVPADIKLAYPSSAGGFQRRWVDGPDTYPGSGSLTEDPNILPLMELLIADNPTQAAGGGGAVVNQGLHAIESGIVA